MNSSHSKKALDAAEISRQIDEQLLRDRAIQDKIVKLLLLGPSESDKPFHVNHIFLILFQVNPQFWSKWRLSTAMALIMRSCSRRGKNLVSLRIQHVFRSLIFSNVVQAMSQLIYGLRRLGYKLPLEYEPDATVVAQAMQDSKMIESSMPNQVYFSIKRLWAEPKIQEIYERRSEFQLIDCAKM